ncbi:MAG: Gfo/Idh/MocA family oxidoreductase [Nitrospirae bacterium]|nr:Gfo/Idh/MocA family oxidoreductase [Nitrospirota bacterium]
MGRIQEKSDNTYRMNKHMKFAVFGRGSIGTKHIHNLQSLGFVDIQAVSFRRDVRKDIHYKQTYGINTLHSIDELSDYNPDAFIIANPTSKHIETAKIAIGMESHIFMEKPLSHSLDGVDCLQDNILKKGLVFLQGNNLRFHPVLIMIKNIIENGDLGDICFARVVAGQYLPDWHPLEDYRDSYSAIAALGGGVVLTLQHEIDYVYWFFGKIKVVKSIVKKVSNLEIDVEDVAGILLETQRCPIVEVHLDYLQQPCKRYIQVQGTMGSLEYSFGDDSLKLHDLQMDIYKEILNVRNYDYNETYLNELTHFIDCIDKGEKVAVNIYDAINVLKICLEIKRGFNN